MITRDHALKQIIGLVENGNLIKLIDILLQENDEESIRVPLRSPEERAKNYLIATNRKIQQYIKDGGIGDLDLSGTPITSLPDGLKVNGYLNLGGTKITALPADLEVGGYLNLRNTPITALPDGLKVNGSLDLRETPITDLPANLEVGGDLYLGNTPLSKSHTKEQIKQMAPGVTGNIYL